MTTMVIGHSFIAIGVAGVLVGAWVTWLLAGARLRRECERRIQAEAGVRGDVSARGDVLQRSVAARSGADRARVLVTARRFRDLKAAPEDTQIVALEPIEVLPRALQAPEMTDAGAAAADRLASMNA